MQPEIEPIVISAASATRELLRLYGGVLEADYVSGKTQFRDALCAAFELSQLEAEELCDELEGASLIRFVESAELGSGWSIEPSLANTA